MVARVDKALKDDLGISEGLAAENVYVLDPCCGTGAYLAEVLRRIALNLEGEGLGALAGVAVRKAATERVFGFEIMPAPFVVAHLQVGLTMQNLGARGRDAPLAADGSCEAGHPDSGDPRKPALQRFRGDGGGRGARALGSVSHDQTGPAARRPGAQRSLRPFLPHGRAAHRGEDRARGGVLHLELLLARRAVLLEGTQRS